MPIRFVELKEFLRMQLFRTEFGQLNSLKFIIPLLHLEMLYLSNKANTANW